MLNVLTLAEADALLEARFTQRMPLERAPLISAAGRVLGEELRASWDLPEFCRSSVDGYALRAGDTFGCSESIPALLKLQGRVEMGRLPDRRLEPACCVYVPTGGALPEGADAVVMLEFAEAFGEYMAILRPAAPGQHLVLRGDDAKNGESVLPAGRVLSAADIGTAAALGLDSLAVAKRPRVLVLSTGDELIPASGRPPQGRMCDVNGPMLTAAATAAGAEARYAGIVPDAEERLEDALLEAARSADLVLLSGASSAGDRDAAARVIASLGTLLFHGLALKPGKPALAGEIGGVPVIGLPGHPAAAYMVFHVLARPLIRRFLGAEARDISVQGRLIVNISSNQGREELVPVRLENGLCTPLISKSGLVTTLSKSCGYIRIPRDCEGLPAGAETTVYLWRNA